MTDAVLDAASARISARLDSRREAVRAEIECRPGLRELYGLTREVFGGSLTYLRTDALEFGTEIPPGIVPAPILKVKRRGRA